jgi:methyl-accepting chemotaxis protein
LKNMKLIVRLLGGFVVVSLIVVAVGLVGLEGNGILSADMQDIARVHLPGAVALITIKEAMTAVEDGENMLLVKGATEEIRKDAYDTFDEAKQRMDESVKLYGSLPLEANEIENWKQFQAALNTWWGDHEELVRVAKEYEASPSDELFTRMFDQAKEKSNVSIDPAQKLLEKGHEMGLKDADAAISNSEKASVRIRAISAVGLIAGPVLALLLGTLLAFSITRPLAKGVAFAQLVAAGDFSQRLDIHQRDEVGTLADSLNEMSAQLSEMVATVQSSADQLAASSEQISTTAQSLAEGAQGQASTLEETSASVEQLSASVDQVSEHARSQVMAVGQSAGTMAEVQAAIQTVSQSMGEISDLASSSVEKSQEGARAVSQVVEGISRIAESSARIGGIVTVISEIADQTNLLALNASIEAARAGEHGRGFAVVADEVSKLADRSSSSTKEIESLIKESVKHVGQGVETASGSQGAMEQIRVSSKKVQEMIAGLSRSMGEQVEAIKSLTSALAAVSEMSLNISAATGEQSANAKQVSRAVENVNETTQAAATSAEELSSSTLELTAMAQKLQMLVGQFKIAGREEAPASYSISPRSRA